MSLQKKVVAIVPAFNEAYALGSVIDDLEKHGVEPIVIDDGSTDNTRSIALRKGVRCISHCLNRGQGAAYATGLQYVRNLVPPPDCIITFDSDGQHHAKDIARLCDPILSGKADVVLGSRFLSGNTIPLVKIIVLKLAVLYTRLTTGLTVTDTHNGLRAFHPKAASLIQLRHSGMAHASELLEEISRLSLRYTEAPVTVSYTAYSKQKGQRLSNSISILFDLWFK